MPRPALAVAVAVLLAAPAAGDAKGGAFRESAHGDRARGVLRIPGAPRGSCAHCHSRGPGEPGSMHGAGSRGRGGDGRGRSRPSDALCLECHGEPKPGGSFQGEAAYAAAAHALSAGAVWPAARGRSPAPGACTNCHDPHGVKDEAGLVPSLLRERGEALCLACHDGSPAKDVATALSRTYVHPLVGDEDPAGATSPGGAATGKRRSGPGTCSACHNPHRAQGDAFGGPEGEAGALAGAARVRVSNGAAGTVPTYTPLGADDPSPVEEHEVCFKCHSSFTKRPPGRADVALALNPANASYHPVEARGRNAGIDPRAFVAGWTWDRRVTCSDCHSADAEGARGPHGSAHPHLLAHRYVAALERQRVEEDDLCFACHAFAAYADPAAGAGAAWSRFAAHGVHAAQGVGCFACHDAHGSATLPALLALRSPGLRTFAASPDGGTCTTTCHVRAPPVAAYRAPRGR